jgi:hypothetical protein
MPDFDATPCAVFPRQSGKQTSFTLHLFPGDSRETWTRHGGGPENFRAAVNGKYYRTADRKFVFFDREGIEWMIRQHTLALLGLLGPWPEEPARPDLPRGAKVYWLKCENDADNVLGCETGGETMIETFTRTEPFQGEHNEWMAYVMGSRSPVPLACLKVRK